MIQLKIKKMKRILYRNAHRLLLGIFSFVLTFGFYSCDNDDKEKFTIVDLRYNPQDSYMLTASSPEGISFQVKSNHPWEVFGNADWYTISPSTGVQDKIFDVEIDATENKMLDDRIDTITIKSDYWIGKQFSILQKGIARLEVNHGNDTTFNSGVDQKSFAVISNQDWSCEVTDGSDWLSIISGSIGNIDGDVTVETIENKGELRNGIVTVFDRHHISVAAVKYIQKGVLLIPAKEEFREDYKEHEVILEVESNTSWIIEKSEYDVWYEITTGTSYNGNTTVKIHMDVNSGVSLRKSEIKLKTVSDDESVSPVVKSVILKQAPMPQPDHIEMDKGFLGAVVANGSIKFENGDMICEGGKNRVNIWLNKLGTHTFRIKEMDLGSSPVWYTINGWGHKEMRYHINTTAGETALSMTEALGGELIGDNVPLDITQPHNLSITISDEGGNYRYDFALDGEHIAYSNTTIASDTKLLLYLGSNNGNCVWDWYEYYPLVDWDN